MNEVATQCVSETPSEPKLCPYRDVPWYPFGEYDVRDPRPPIPGQFGACLQEKCAMWRDKRFIYLPTGEVLRDDSYCGLAGRT